MHDPLDPLWHCSAARGRSAAAFLSTLFLFLSATSVLIAQETARKLPFDDPRYQEYKTLRDEFANLYEEYSARDQRGNLIIPMGRREAIRKRVKEINEAVRKLEAQHSDSPNPDSLSDQLTDTYLRELDTDTYWIGKERDPDRKREYMRRGPNGEAIRPYRTYLKNRDLLDELTSVLARPNLSAALKERALARLQALVESMKKGIDVIKRDPDASQTVIQILDGLRRDAELLKGRVSTPTGDRDRQAFIRELKGYQQEIQSADAAFQGIFDYSKPIIATYRAAFVKAGADDWNGNAAAWSQFFYTRHITGMDSPGGTIYRRPLAVLAESIRNLEGRSPAPFTQADIAYFHQRMVLWREQARKLTPQLLQLIDLQGQLNADLKARYRLKSLTEAQFNAREKARSAERDRMLAEVNVIQRNRIFAYSVGAKIEPRISS